MGGCDLSYSIPLYKDKTWLFNAYIKSEDSIFDMANNSGALPSTIIRWLKYYKIDINPIDSSCIYFLLSKDTNRVKIGYSTQLSIRIKDLILMNGTDLELIAYKLGDQSEEVKLHKMFIEDRLYGEWFNYSDNINKYIKMMELDINQLNKINKIIIDTYKNQQIRISRSTRRQQEFLRQKIYILIKDFPGITMYAIMQKLTSDLNDFISIGKVQNIVNYLENNNKIKSDYKNGKRLLYLV